MMSRFLNRVTRRRTESPIPTIGQGISVFMAKRLAGLVVQRRIAIGTRDTPDQVAQRVVALMASRPDCDPPGARAAGARSTTGS